MNRTTSDESPRRSFGLRRIAPHSPRGAAAGFRVALFVGLLGLWGCLGLAGPAEAQADGTDAAAGVPAGTLERIRVHGESLNGNLSGDDPERDVVVYLPPSYADSPNRRYPVVYFLHGYTVGAEVYVQMLGLPGSADRGIRNGAQEMIVVLPDAYTIYGGSMYSNSPTTGNWEGFVSRDLVDHIDATYRTLPSPGSRGLSGHSMGGYGTVRIGMKHPETFGALYAMSSCCLMNDPSEDVPGPDEPPPEPSPDGGFANAIFAQAAAWAPNPQAPPLYLDLPWEDGELRPQVAAKWIANSPVVMVDQYVPALQSYTAIAMDVGDADPLGAANFDLDVALTRLEIAHTFEEYEGNHTNRVSERFEMHVLPFFSEHLVVPDPD